MNRILVGRVLSLGLLGVLVVLALSACGGDEKKAKARPLPEDEKALQPGVYRSKEFEPSFSFRVGAGWEYVPPEASDMLTIRRTDETGGLGFAVTREVYQPSKTGTPNVVEAPKDFVDWLQRHPYLRTTEPRPITVGGVEGVRVDVMVEGLPDDYRGRCGSDCVDIGRLSTGSETLLGEGYKLRLTVLDDMQGKPVSIGIVSPASDFDGFAPEAQKVIDTVQWRGS